MKYIFIRHGKTHFNEIGLKQGWCDSPLTKEGIQQIEKMSQLLKDEKITKAYTSPTLRAKQTAQIILKEHDVLLHEDERLKEVNFGVLEGLPCSFVDTLHLESPSWLDDLEMDYTSYQGENIDDVIIRQQKVLKEIEKISNEEDCIVVDLRGRKDYDVSHIENAINLPNASLKEIEEFNKKDKIWILYCKRGSLSFKLANEMNKVGYKVKAVVGGFKKI